jgi:hypothetical protein
METLLAEANELLAIFAASDWTARAGQLSQWLDDPMAQWLNDPMTR